MSTVKDSQGNILNRLPIAVVQGKYSDERALERDWFDLHPEDRPVEKTETSELSDSLPSAGDLDVVEKEKEVAAVTAASSSDAPASPASSEVPAA